LSCLKWEVPSSLMHTILPESLVFHHLYSGCPKEYELAKRFQAAMQGKGLDPEPAVKGYERYLNLR
jgi:hypothetical protein